MSHLHLVEGDGNEPTASAAVPLVAASANAPRLVVERLVAQRLVGWCYDDAAPGEERLELWADGELCVLDAERVERQDVVDAIGAEVLRCGFEVDLPPSWLGRLVERPDQARFAVNGHPVEVPGLARVVDDRFVRDPDAVPAHAVEGLRGLTLYGWLADGDRPMTIALSVQGRPVPVPVRRVERDDVAQALAMAADGLPGFEIELPGSLWHGLPEGEDARLQVTVDGQPAGGSMLLRRSQLSALLRPDQRPSDPRLDRAHTLLVLEHLALAGQLPATPRELREPLMSRVAELDLQAWIDNLLNPVDRDGASRDADWQPQGRFAAAFRSAAAGRAAAAALRTLLSLPATRARGQSLELALTRACGLFDRRLYLSQVGEAPLQGRSPLRHYVEQGDAMSLVPNAFLDPRGYIGQLPGRRHPGFNRLLHYALVGRHQGLSPSAWFDVGHYGSRNPDVARRGLDPLAHFLQWGWNEGREPVKGFDASRMASQTLLQRLGRESAGVGAPPALHHLLRGLPDDAPLPFGQRLPWMPSTRLDGIDWASDAVWDAVPVRDALGAAIDVVVPVYAGVQETLRCLHSVLTAPVRLPFGLVVVDDCSPDPALSAALKRLSQRGLLELLVNERNLGFVRTVNRALQVHTDRDAVVLNADTLVCNDWLDRLVSHAQAAPDVATVTPLSNNATICSYPRSDSDNAPPGAAGARDLDLQAAAANAGVSVEAPTGIGFCMYMRRRCLDDVGLLDAERYGRGYGEENDWCLRAAARGWRHLIAADIYVVHQGAVSFARETGTRVAEALALVAERYPHYEPSVRAYIAADPLAPARRALDLARLRHAARGRSFALQIGHARGGGTARHEAEQAARLRDTGLAVLQMRPSSQAGCVALVDPDGLDLPNLSAIDVQSPDVLDQILRELPVAELHLHHLADLPPGLRGWLARAAATRPLDITVHDYHLICPRINLATRDGRYCGEPDEAECDRCLAASVDDVTAAVADAGIAAWRHDHAQLVMACRRVTVPHDDVRQRLRRYLPQAADRLAVVPHETGLAIAPARLAPDAPVRNILVVGAISRVKGYDVLLAAARSAAAARLGVRFELLGYSMDDDALRAAGVRVHGRYDDAELVRHLTRLKPDLVWLPSLWPETYCYVLSAAFQAGERVAVFDLGAPAARLRAADGRAARCLPLALANHADGLVDALVRQPAGVGTMVTTPAAAVAMATDAEATVQVSVPPDRPVPAAGPAAATNDPGRESGLVPRAGMGPRSAGAGAGLPPAADDGPGGGAPTQS